MRKIILLIFSITLFSFVDVSSDKKNPYFEGQIIYGIEYISNHVKMSPTELEQYIGSKMVLTFKNGNYKKEFFSPEGKLVRETICNIKELKSYSRSHYSDTIYFSDVKRYDVNTTLEILSDTTIDNHPCAVVKTGYTFQTGNPDMPISELEDITIYAKDLAVNPDWYADYNEGRYNEIIAYTKGIFIARISKDLYWEEKMKFKSINARKVVDSELEMMIDKNTPLKEL